MNFVKKESKQSYSSVKLVTTFPKKIYDNAEMTLEEAKFSKSEALNVNAA